MGGKLRTIVTLLVCGLVLAAGAFGLLRPLDNALRDLRFATESKPVSDRFVFVDIDSRSIEAIGVWPWPRSVHSRIVDALMEAGANDVAFDVDFSTPSSETEDATFEAALERAGGYVHLAALRQLAAADGQEQFNVPLPRFAQHANAATVNVGLEAGIVRTYPFAMTLGPMVYPSLAATLAGVEGPPDESFIINFAINADAIDRLAVADILDGNLDPAQIEGRSVIVGASALELSDTFVVPHFGVIPGAIVQLLAAETLLPGNMLTEAGWLPTAIAVLLLALVALFPGRRGPLWAAVAGGAVIIAVVETAALLLQIKTGLLVETAAVDIVAVVLMIEALVREVRVRQRAHAEAARQRDAMRAVLDRVIADNFDGIVIIDGTSRVVAASALAEEMLGRDLSHRSAAEVLPERLRFAVEDVLVESGRADVAPSEMQLALPDGGIRMIEYTITRSEIPDTSLGARQHVACLTFRDVTERRRTEERLRYLASHDPLTGALSRLELAEIIHARFANERGRAAGAVLAIFDLSRFASVNETLGHDLGDEVLKQVVSRLGASGVEAVARVGGDSFAVLIERSLGDVEIEAFCVSTVERIALPYELRGGHQALISAVAGATHSGVSGFDPEMLLSHADMAVSDAKSTPGRGVVLFTPAMDTRLKERQDMDAALRQALARRELSLMFQTQVELATDRTVGVEALVRWTHPELGAVSPALFIPIAEETGQIIEIGRWVLMEACREVASWPGDMRLAVNVSPIQLEMSNVVDDVATALRVSGLAPARLDVEITEGMFVSKSSSVIGTLERVRALGVGISLDDFGTGYSSLSYLGRLPVDKIKIDQSFVKSLPANAEAEAIIRAVLTISETLHKVVVAEGVETADQAWMLKMMGCAIGQGYLFGRPRSGADMRSLLADPAAAAALRVPHTSPAS